MNETDSLQPYYRTIRQAGPAGDIYACWTIPMAQRRPTIRCIAASHPVVRPLLIDCADAKQNLQNLRLKHVDEQGYVSLRCHWFQGCPVTVNLTSSPYLDPLKENPTTDFDHLYTSTLHYLLPTLPIPKAVGAPCCSQFAVTASAIRKHKKGVYVKIRKWLIDTQLDDYDSGRVLEYMWHILFGKEAIHCPDADDCYCRMYGKCGLKCEEGDCGQYQYPINIPRLKTWWWKITHLFG